MTTQIVIMNRMGLAMCADSVLAVPCESDQLSVNNMDRRLFQMTGEIGFMSCNALSHCGVAMEVLLKGFRKRIKGEAKATVSKCAQDFLQYLESTEIPRNPASKASFRQLARDLASEIRAENGGLDARMSRLMGRVRRQERLFQTGNGKLAKEDQDFSAQALREALEVPERDLPSEAAAAFSEICLEAMSRQRRSSAYSGLVFAGFGEDENFPCVEHWIIDGTHEGRLRHWRDQESCVDLNTQGTVDACVTPFAKGDVSHLLMSGFDHEILPDLINAITDLVRDIFKRFSNFQQDEETIEREIRKKQRLFEQAVWKALRQSAHERAASFLEGVAKLEAEDLAYLAKAFVGATSARRMIGADLGPAWGPFNLSVITKANGFGRIGGFHPLSLEIDPSLMRH